MAYFLGIDTSNYTTSTALYNDAAGTVVQSKKILPVKDGALGLRQSDAVFAHIKQIGALMEGLLPKPEVLAGIGVSVRPRDVEGSYMPCFLVGEAVAQTIASVTGAPLSRFSHQAGHVAAALYSAGQLAFAQTKFAAFHLSGGTTECLIVTPGEQQPFAFELFASSLDLKAGQAVDRVGGMLGLAFPAGKALEQLAMASDKCYSPKIAFQGTNCALSGIENKCAQMVANGEPSCDVARYCLDSIRVAVERMTRLVREAHGEIPVVYAGGVMSNTIIRDAITKQYGGFFAEPAFSCDNAAGVAILAAQTNGGEL